MSSGFSGKMDNGKRGRIHLDEKCIRPLFLRDRIPLGI
jgi:hypothetical protein